MKPYQVVGWSLAQTTAITAIVSTRIYHGLRAEGSVVPCINYYEVGGLTQLPGMVSQVYSINCRAASAGAARDLAYLVMDLFLGTSRTGTYGYQNSAFEITRASLENDGGLIPEPEDGIYNAPIDIRLVFPVSTIS